MTHSQRTLMAMAFAALCAGVSLTVLLIEAFSPREDLVNVYESRYASLRAELKTSEAVGYLSDLPSSGLENQTELRLLQYAVAPVIVVNNLTPHWIAGNFRTSGGIAEATKGKNLTLVKDLGQGIFLYRK